MIGTEQVQAREGRPRAGVYSLTCRATGRTYLGCSEHLADAIEAHRTQLAAGRHPLRELQSDWDAHGPASFAVAVHDELGAHECCDGQVGPRLAELRDLWADQLGLDEGALYSA